MGTVENKAVVSRFMNDVTTGRNFDPELIDELCAPNYVNVAMGDADLDGFKAMGAAMLDVLKDVRVDDLELVADGDAVFARFNHTGAARRDHDDSTRSGVLPPRRRQDRGERRDVLPRSATGARPVHGARGTVLTARRRTTRPTQEGLADSRISR